MLYGCSLFLCVGVWVGVRNERNVCPERKMGIFSSALRQTEGEDGCEEMNNNNNNNNSPLILILFNFIFFSLHFFSFIWFKGKIQDGFKWDGETTREEEREENTTPTKKNKQTKTQNKNNTNTGTEGFPLLSHWNRSRLSDACLSLFSIIPSYPPNHLCTERGTERGVEEATHQRTHTRHPPMHIYTHTQIIKNAAYVCVCRCTVHVYLVFPYASFEMLLLIYMLCLCRNGYKTTTV
eukprot:gene12770-8708_t